jgi:hypothetical protein
MADLIITENYLKQSSIINDNADMKVITPTVILVQDLYIHPILGTDLFNEIKTQISNSSVSATNQTLLDDYILPTMVWYLLCECTPVFKYRYMNKGIMVKNSENSQPADLTEIQYLMDKWKNNAEAYAQRATNFLIRYSTTYPLYLANFESDEIKPNMNNYTSGLFLDGGDCGCSYRTGHN